MLVMVNGNMASSKYFLHMNFIREVMMTKWCLKIESGQTSIIHVSCIICCLMWVLMGPGIF